MKTLRFSAAALVVAALFVACGGDDASKPAAGASATADKLLQYVPGDTPYVFAALQPQPEALREKFEPMIKMAVDQYHGMFVQARAAMVENSEGDAPADLVNVLDVLIDETADGDISDFGFDSERDLPVIYGNGLLPVMRLSISDAAAWERTYDRLTKDLENAPTSITIDGTEVDVFGGEAPVNFFVAQQDGMLVITLGPSGMEADFIGELVGATKPSQSILDSGALAAVSERYGFVPQMQGFIDFRKVFSMLSTSGNNLNDALFAMAPTLPLELTDTCRAEMAGLFDIMPRMVVGSTRLDAKGTDTLAVIELREDVATAMQPIAGVMPGLTAKTDAAIKMGSAFDLKNLRSWVETTLGGVTESPFECEQLAGLNGIAMQAFVMTQTQFSPIVYNFKGYSIEIGSLDGLEGLAQQQMPENVEMDLTIGFENVEGLLMLGQMSVPQLSSLALEPNGKAVALPADLTGPLPLEGFVAMTDDLISVSTGEDAARRVEANAGASASGETALLGHFDMDGGAYFGFLAEMMESGMSPALESDNMPEQQRAMLETQQKNMRAMAEAYEKLFDRLSFSVLITERGIEMPAKATFK